jgi:site-specific DNA recombinase
MRVAIYCRVSTELQEEEGNSLETQERLLTELARQRGWEYEVFREVGSGTTIQKRPALQNLLARLPEFQAICVVDFDRLARPTDLIEYGMLKAALKKAGVKVITPTQEFSFENEQDDFISDLLALIGRWERMMIIRRTQRGRWEKMKQGYRYGQAQRVYGYRYNDGKMEIVEEEAEVVREIFQMAKRMGAEKIAKELTRRGIPTPSGRGKWHASEIRRILYNPIYGGRPALGRGRIRKTHYPHPLKTNLEEWIWVEKEVPAIIPFKEWWDVCKRIYARHPGRYSPLTYLLTGILKCPVCGKGMLGNGRDRKREGVGYYACRCRKQKDGFRYSIRTDKIEWIAEEIFYRLKNSGELLTKIKEELEQREGVETHKSEGSILKRLEEIERARDRLIELYTEGKIEKQKFDEKWETLEQRRRALERQLELARERRRVADVEIIFQMVQELEWNDLTREQQKEFCRFIIKRIEIDTQFNIRKIELFDPFEKLGI